MRSFFVAAALMFAAAPAFAQTPAPAAPAPKLFVGSSEVQSLIAKAKSMPPQPLILQPLATLAPYTAMLEYRAGAANPASVHPTEIEYMYVVDGSGTLLQGGTLTDKKTIDGGTPRPFAKGDLAIVPEGVPHQLIPDSGVALILVTFKAPRPLPAK